MGNKIVQKDMLYEALIKIQEEFGGKTIEAATKKAHLSNEPSDNAKTTVLNLRFMRSNIKVKEELDGPSKNIGSEKSAGARSEKNL